MQGGPECRAVLAEVYVPPSDVDVKRRILRAFMVAGEKDRLFKAAQGEQNPELRAEAVGQLGNMGAHEELWQLYQKETSVDVKRRIIRAMQIGGSVDRLIELAKAEQNPELRRDVVRALGVMRTARTGDVAGADLRQRHQPRRPQAGDQRAVHRRRTRPRWSPSPARSRTSR